MILQFLKDNFNKIVFIVPLIILVIIIIVFKCTEGKVIEGATDANLNPDIFTDSTRDKRANLSIFLKDLSYQNFEDNSHGLMQIFNCSGVVQSQSLSISSDGYLNGTIAVKQLLR